MNRELIYSTLFAKVSSAADFVTTSRRLVNQGDIEAAQMPALMQLQNDQTVYRVKGMPAKYTLPAELWLYAFSDDKNAAPSSVINPLIDAVSATLDPDAFQETQTLGIAGVEKCAIEGKILIFEGLLGNTVIAMIPVTVIAT